VSKPSESPIQFVKGVGPAKAKLFANLGVYTVEDLLYLFPNRYEDRSNFTPIAKLEAGKTQSITGEVLAVGKRNFYSKHKSFEIAVGDKTGKIYCMWFNMPFLDKYFKMGQEIVFYGRVDVYKNRLQMVMPDFELINPEDRSLNMGRIVPVYPLTKGITQRYLRKLIHSCLDEYGKHMRDMIPEDIRKRHKLSHISKTVSQIHFPANLDQQKKAIERIAFEEFFLFQISVILRRLSIIEKKGVSHAIADELVKEYAASLPFPLTGAQLKSLKEIVTDMSKERPMLRLIQGDVGSGKTVVAFFGCIAAWENGRQSAIMAPTEILAVQHYESFKRLFEKGPFKDLKVALLVSSLPKKEKDSVLKQLREGDIDLIVGTHALLEDTVSFKHLSFVVIDEQHKFGVSQRALLSAKANNPDVLIMTATPIPRTLCLTLYGDLEVSTINEMPPGRGKISTYHVKPDKAPSIYEKVRQAVRGGTQAYIIYPMVEESEKMDLKAAKDMFEHFTKFEFKDLRLGLVHGQMDRRETDEIMNKFKRHELDILVATTILEVGIDVANANVMVIEHAERFGLSQLHQMRGRIGRGKKDAACILIGDPVTDEGKARIEAITSTTDGFKIAEKDLEIRGPGHYFGRHQSGLNELKVANPVTQLEVLEKSRKEAISLTQVDPKLNKGENTLIKEIIKKRYPQFLELILAG
jgi:ATP-dependent DNA helicase RecG